MNRGSDWEWQDSDGGEGSVGELCGFRRLDGSVEGRDPGLEQLGGICVVKWIGSGIEQTYEMGAGGVFALNLLLNSLHPGGQRAARQRPRRALGAAARRASPRTPPY